MADTLRVHIQHRLQPINQTTEECTYLHCTLHLCHVAQWRQLRVVTMATVR